MSELPSFEPSYEGQNALYHLDRLARLKRAVEDPVVMGAAESLLRNSCMPPDLQEQYFRDFVGVVHTGGYVSKDDPGTFPSQVLETCLQNIIQERYE